MWNFVSNTAYKASGVVLRTGLAKAAIRWTLKPMIMAKVNERKEQVKKQLAQGRASFVENIVTKKVAGVMELGDAYFAQGVAALDDVTAEKNIDIAINVLCNHFGDFNDVNKLGEELGKLIEEAFNQKIEAFKKEMINPEAGIIKVKMAEEIADDMRKVSHVAFLSKMEKEELVKHVKEGTIVKKIQAFRDTFSDQNIKAIIDRTKVLLTAIFDNLKFIDAEKQQLNAVVDELLGNHVERFKQNADKLIILIPNMLQHLLEESLSNAANDEVLEEVPEVEHKKAIVPAQRKAAKAKAEPKKADKEDKSVKPARRTQKK